MRFVVAVAAVAGLLAVAAGPVLAQAPAHNPVKTLTPDEVQQLNAGQKPAATPQPAPVQNPVKDITPGGGQGAASPSPQQGPAPNPVQDITPGSAQPAVQPPAQPGAPVPAQSQTQTPAKPKAEPVAPARPAVPGDDIWRTGAQINLDADNHYDVWAAGALAAVRGDVGHKLYAAGAEVDVNTTTQGNGYVAGAIVSVAGRYARDLYVAGARVSIDAQVAGALKAGGARVLIGPQAQLRGPAQIAGADVVFSGVSHGRTELYGDTVEVDGHVTGDLVVRARSVVVGKTARIDGNVAFQSFNQPVIEPGALIRGRQTVSLPQPDVSRFQAAQAQLGLVLYSIAAGFLAGLVLLIVRRPVVTRAVTALRDRPGHSLGLGILIFILLPVIALLLMATVVGIPTGLLLLMSLPLLWLVSTVIAAFTMGDFLLNRTPRVRGFFGQLWALLVGLVVLSVIGIIPFLGVAIWLIALLVGLGAFWQGLKAPQPLPEPVVETPAEEAAV